MHAHALFWHQSINQCSCTYPVSVVDVRPNLARRPLLLAWLRRHHRVRRDEPEPRTNEFMVVLCHFELRGANIGPLVTLGSVHATAPWRKVGRGCWRRVQEEAIISSAP